MKNTIPNGTGNSRNLKSVQDFLSRYPDYESFARALMEGTLPVDIGELNEEGISQRGTPLTKATLLSDATAKALGLQGDATVNDALAVLPGKMDAQKYELTQGVASQSAVLRREFSAADTALRNALEETDTTLRNKIFAAETQLTGNLNTMGQTMRRQISTTESQIRSTLTGEVNRINSSLTSEVNRINGVLGTLSKDRVAAGSYTGNGSLNRYISLPGSPKLLVLSGYYGNAQVKYPVLTIAFQGGGGHDIIDGAQSLDVGRVTIEGNGFRIRWDNTTFRWHNISGIIERYCAIW